MLQARGARIRAYDPQGRAKAEGLIPGVEWCNGALEAGEGADIVVILTEWNEFRALDLRQLREVMSGNVVLDLRNVYAEATVSEAGLVYYGICKSVTPLDNGRKTRSMKFSSGADVPHVTH
jgi:UDPglucose 6-dehydrogenase